MKNSAHKKPVYLELQRNWAALYFFQFSKNWNYDQESDNFGQHFFE